MGSILDSIRIKEVLDSPETVISDWASPVFSLDDREAEFSISITYQNGISPSANFVLQISSDGVNFGDIIESSQIVSDESGTHLWDISGSGALYMRVKIYITSGSLEISNILYAGKQRH